MRRSFRLFSIGPRLEKRGGVLRAVSALRLRLLSLGAFRREVVVHPRNRWLLVRDRRFWLWHASRSVPFDRVEAVTYGFEDWTPGGWFFGARDTQEMFRVGLRLAGGAEFDLFRFYGDGSFVNETGWPDWLYWEEYLHDLTGAQERESRLFAELLCQMIGVKMDRPRY